VFHFSAGLRSNIGKEVIFVELFSQEMTKDCAGEILNWRYPPPHDMYNQVEDEAGFAELLDESYKVVLDQDGRIIGFYCIGDAAQVPKGHNFGVYEKVCIDFGLGMKPELTGRGFGCEFLTFVLREIGAGVLRLTVAKFNERAIRLYEKFEFERVDEFCSGDVEFIVMLRKV